MAKFPPVASVNEERLWALGAKDPASESGTIAPEAKARTADSEAPAVAERYRARNPEENVEVSPVAISVIVWALNGVV